MTTPRKTARPKILVIDIGGSHVKCLLSSNCGFATLPDSHGGRAGRSPAQEVLSGGATRRRFTSGPGLTPQQMVQRVLELAADWQFDVISIGYPGVVRQGAPAVEPHHLAPGWVGFDFAAAFGRPVRIVNDAAMQALGSYQGGKMLFLGLGTGLGSALIVDGHIVAMELGHLRRSSRNDYEDLLGKRGYKRLGKKKWRRKVHAVVNGFAAALLPDEIVVGGGQAERLKTLPPRSRLGTNAAAFLGGFRLWDESPPAQSPATYRDLS